MMVDDIYYPDGGGRKKRDKKKADFYFSLQHNNGELKRVPLTATGYGDFLRDFRDMGESHSRYIWMESVNSDKYIISREVLMNGIIKIEKS